MTVEFGIFSDEGLIEGACFSEEEAEDRIKAAYPGDNALYIAEICSEHPEQEREYCELCLNEEPETT